MSDAQTTPQAATSGAKRRRRSTAATRSKLDAPVAEPPRLQTYRARRPLFDSASRVIPFGALFQAEPSDPRVLAGLGELVESPAPADVAAALDQLS